MKKKLKARRMWATAGTLASKDRRSFILTGVKLSPYDVPVAVIPLDDVDALIIKARDAYVHHGIAYSHAQMRAALAAIGVLPKQRKGRK